MTGSWPHGSSIIPRRIQTECPYMQQSMQSMQFLQHARTCAVPDHPEGMRSSIPCACIVTCIRTAVWMH